MSKIKKLLIFIIFAISICLIPKNVNAIHTLDSTYKLNYSTLIDNKNLLYCIDHGSPLNAWRDVYKLTTQDVVCKGYNKKTSYVNSEGKNQTYTCGSAIAHETAVNAVGKHIIAGYKTYSQTTEEVWYNYKVIDCIKINTEGDILHGDVAKSEATGIETTAGVNAKLAYVLAHGNGYKGTFYNGYSAGQMAVYYYFDEFKNPFLSIQVSASNKTFGSNKIENNEIIQGAEQYATNLAQWKNSGGVLEDKTTKNQTGEVTTTLEYLNDVDGARKAFLKVGPITWQFPGEIGEFHVNNDSISGVRAGTYEGQNFKVGKCDSNIIKSGTPFYVLIPADSGVSNISINAKIKDNINVYSADIAILQYAGKQYLIEGVGNKIPVDGNINVDYKLASGSLLVQKRDVYNKDYPVVGVTFVFQHKATGLYVAKNGQGQIIYVSDEKNAAKYTTGTHGETMITGIVEGTYIAKEIEINNQNYTINKGRKTTISISREKIAQGEIITKPIYNKKNPVKINIKGKVWTLDKDGKDESAINDTSANEYKDGKEGYLLVEGINTTLFRNAILVDIYDANGNVIDVGLQSITDANGNVIDEKVPEGRYELKDMDNNVISIEQLKTTMYTDANGNYILNTMITYPDKELKAYSVKFNYDGIDFKGSNTPNYNNISNGSKALEDTTQRTNLDNKYATISGRGDNSLTNGIATNANDRDKINLEYNVSNGAKGQNAQSKIKGLSAGYNENKNSQRIKANKGYVNSITAAYYFEKGSQRVDNPGAYESYFNQTDNTVTGINLMLAKRESPDLAVTNKIENVVTTINGYNNLYKTTLTKNNLDPNNSDMKVGVTYVTDEEELSKFTVYPSDVKTWANDSEISDKLQVYITYKVSITNQSTTLYNKVKELAIYYDKNYELQYIGDRLDESKNNYAATKDYYSYSDSKYGTIIASNYPSEYRRVYIPVNGVISNNNSKDLYMTFKVSDEEIKHMLAENTYTPTMKNVIEISAYSTYYDEGATKYYAGVDKDSAPGNVNISKLAKQTVDGDTGIAREFTISQKGERTLTGAVFLDDTDNVLKTGEERRGNSIFEQDENEKLFKNLDIKLVGDVDSESTNKVTGTTTITRNNTNKVIYEIDNGEHITDGNTYFISGFIPGEYKISYTYNNKTCYIDGPNEVNINTVDYKSAIVYDVDGKTKVKSALEGKNTDWYKLDNPRKDGEGPFTRYNEAVDNYTIRQTIDNKYKTVDINNSGNTTQNDTSSMTAYTPLMQITVELNTTSSGNTYTPQDYHIINMDFGITERPRQEMKIEKEVSSIKLTLTNGQVLMDVIIKDGEVQNTVSGMKVFPRTTDKKGTVSLELDSELIHGATLEIGYTMKATNISELDYTDENYYKYGSINKDAIVKITPSKVLDYTDNSLTFVKEQNNDDRWNIVEATKDGKNSDRLNVSKTQIVDNKLYEDVKGNEIKKSNINTIVESDYWANKESALAPNEANSQLNLKLTKLLSNTDEEMTYNNDVEIVQVTKTGGRSVQTQIGKYSFGGEGIGGSSEEITITPPTGEDQDNTIYYTAGIALAIFLVVSAVVVTFIIRRKNK